MTNEKKPGLTLARILLAVANPATAPGLVRLAAALKPSALNGSLTALHVVTAPKGMALEEARSYILRMRENYEGPLMLARECAQGLGTSLCTELRVERAVTPGILAAVGELQPTDLVLLGWNGTVGWRGVCRGINQEVAGRAQVNLGMLRDRGMGGMRRILVPIGWGPHARFGLRLAERLAQGTGAVVTAFRVLPAGGEVDWECERAAFDSLVSAEAPALRYDTELRLVREVSAVRAILAETERRQYDLLIIGASDEWWLRSWLYGAIPDQVVERAPCSVLVVRRWMEPTEAG